MKYFSLIAVAFAIRSFSAAVPEDAFKEPLPNLSVSEAQANQLAVPVDASSPTRRLGSEQVQAKQVQAKQIQAKQIQAKQVQAKQIQAKQVQAKQVQAKQVQAKQVQAKQVQAQQIQARQVQAQQCTGVAPWNTSDWDTWCETNCNQNPSYCPSSHCYCGPPEPPPTPLSCQGVAPWDTPEQVIACEATCNSNPSYCPSSHCDCIACPQCINTNGGIVNCEALNDKNIHTAVDLWVQNPTNATATFGDISCW
ncbi:hypothetical protein TrVE_jg3823 [Triparma verrucosa]|uniref:Uncharacterized protein n=1 Tax=Triparma verrucosa TaxID=1606542 RepID=A0A9W7CFN4_9STRA|nr:hypothetical protein TrVE_jg3823 [Triparma verrucosa]